MPSASSASPSAALSSLDRSTQLVTAVLYPDAAEGVVVVRPSQEAGAGSSYRYQDAVRELLRRESMTADERAALRARVDADNRATAARRARGRVRRYAVANGCSRLWTLTCADQTKDRAIMVRRVRRMLRVVNAAYPRLAWVWVLERHKSGALHAHVAVSEYVDYVQLRRMWGAGIVDVRKIRAHRKAGGGRESARLAARYVAKYIGKDPVGGRGEHSYDVRQGFQPRRQSVVHLSFRAGYAWAVEQLGAPAYVWASPSVADWTGPPCMVLGWA